MTSNDSYSQLFFGVVCASGLIALTVLKLSFAYKNRSIKPRARTVKLIDSLIPYSRRVVFSLTLLWSVGLYAKAAYSFEEGGAALSFLARSFGLSALAGIFVVLSVGLMNGLFPRAAINPLLNRASRGIGLSVFYLACLHAAAAFTSNLDSNLSAAFFLSPKHRLALLCSSVAFIILLAMAATSQDKIIAKLTFARWKKLHRFIHLAAILVVVHAFLIGSHFLEANRALPLTIMTISLTILLLEVATIHLKLTANRRSISKPAYQYSHAGLAVIMLLGMGLSYYGLSTLSSPTNPHANHSNYLTNYSLNITHSPQNFLPGEQATLTLSITDTSTNQTQTNFYESFEKLLHLIVISEDMQEFHHLHPEQTAPGSFEVTFTPKNGGKYVAYADFSPQPNREGLAMAEIASDYPPLRASEPLELTNRMQTTAKHTVSMDAPDQIKAGESTPLTFTVTDKTGQPLTTLEPYLGQYGHLAVIHENKQSYLHVHPADETTQQADGKLGFSAVLAQPGKYSFYLQFSDDGTLYVARYTVEVQ